MIRLVQISSGREHRVAMVREDQLELLACESTYQLAMDALAKAMPLARLIENCTTGERISYDAAYQGEGDWKFGLPLDHPTDNAHCHVSGTGLTHLGSAKNRQAMHGVSPEHMTDSMRMFELGVAGGKPNVGDFGVAPEWFYKGDGSVLRAHRQAIELPCYAEDGGEEAEIAGVYIISPNGIPCRVGMAIGNEFSDHVFEKKNYLNLAGSKLRQCGLGPELIIGAAFDSIAGESRIERDAKTIWSKPIHTGQDEMCHSLANIEHHHFKFAGHRQPGDVHIHFYGAHSLSFGDGVRLRDGDVMQVSFDGFGRPLRNVLKADSETQRAITVAAL